MSGFDLRGQLEAIKNVETYGADNDYDTSRMSQNEVYDVLSRAVDSISQDFSNVADDDNWDIYRSILKGVTTSPQNILPVLMTEVLDSLVSAFANAVEDTHRSVDTFGQEELGERRQVLETYAFLLHWFVLGAEKYKGAVGTSDGPSAAPKARRGRGGKAVTGGRAKKTTEWSWVDRIEPALALIVKVLKIRSQKIWPTAVDRDTFLQALMSPVYCTVEKDASMKIGPVRGYVFQAICLAVMRHNHSTAAKDQLMQLLGYSEPIADHIADLLAMLATDHQHTALSESFLREVAKKTWVTADSTGPKSFSRFLIRLGEIAPQLILKELNALQNHLDNDAYQMRNAIVENFGAIIRNQLETAEDREHAQKTIDSMFKALLPRALDMSSYVRSRVFQVLARILVTEPNDVFSKEQRRRFMKQRVKITIEACVALEDKTATVRKQALICLRAAILMHPYMAVKDDLSTSNDLRREDYAKCYNKALADEKAHKAQLAALARDNGALRPAPPAAEDQGNNIQTSEQRERRKSRRRSGNDEMDVDREDDDDDETDSIMDETDSIISDDLDEARVEEELRRIDLSALDEAHEALATHEIKSIQHAELIKTLYKEALSFIDTVNEAIVIACTLLGSKHKVEVPEAIELLRLAHKKKMSSAEKGMRAMVHLIWQKDNNAPPTTAGEEVVTTGGVRAKLMETYQTTYLTPQEQVGPHVHAKEVARQLLDLTECMSLAELTSFEELLRQMMDEGRVDGDVMETLWLLYERNLPLVQRRGAIILLGMFALSNPSIMLKKQSTLLKIGLGKHGKADLRLAKHTCIALQRMTGSKKKVKGSLEDNRQRFAISNPLFRRLIDALETPTHDRAWFAFAEQAINAVYALAERPEIVVERVEQDSDAMELDDKETQTPDGAVNGEQDMAPTPQPQAATGPSNPSAISGGDAGDAFSLSQMFFVVGHVAMKHIVHLELIEREMKRQKQELELAAKQGASQQEKEDEIEQVAGNAEDDIGEHIKHVREGELLYGEQSLLRVYGPLLVYVCGSPQIYKDPTLRAAATLSFAKFLCISGKFCEEHYKLLFKILETSRDPNIRANLVIGIGDLAVSFATIIDERLNNLYMGLNDDDLIVKKNTLMVLTHLILNGMIKVKGQLAEMAKCTEDGEQRVSDLAKLFFHELSTKDNAIYNNLPDMISHLSIGAFAVSEETFQNTMRFIFTFIEKERQAENIVEKLCQRFKLVSEPRQWRDVAFCLSLLPFRAEKSLKKLVDGLPYYKDKLYEEGVYSRFLEILAKAKSAKKAEAQSIQDFEKILDDSRQKHQRKRFWLLKPYRN
ncbi:unnamed protein product [Peniophora sp. CBMAI 1063]|nr:unnamed protein product [Peniophora sp. CBMAI 1063]